MEQKNTKKSLETYIRIGEVRTHTTRQRKGFRTVVRVQVTNIVHGFILRSSARVCYI